MARGTLLWFDASRGYGFIRPELGPRDVFVHVSAFETEADIPAGASVDFELVQTGEGRLVARRVVPVDRPLSP
jgi:CspA family cold shock protein